MIDRVFQKLEQSGLFRDFPTATKTQLSKRSRILSVDKGQRIFQIGDQPEALHGVVEGAVKLLGETPTGKLFFYGLIPPGYWFGEVSVLDGGPRGQTAVAAADTKLVHLPRKYLMTLLREQPQLYKHFLAVFCLRLRSVGQVLEDAAFIPVKLRLAKHLLLLHKVRLRCDIKLSQEDLAASLSVTRQSISKALGEWHRNEWITITYGDVRVIKPEPLEKLINESLN